MTPRQVRWFMVGFWLVLLSGSVSLLVRDVGGLRALLLTLLVGALAQMGYGVLCRRLGKPRARDVLRLGSLVLLPAAFFLNGLTGDLLTVVIQVCQLVATLDWSDDDIGGWGRRRWVQVKRAARRFSRPVMGGLTPRA